MNMPVNLGADAKPVTFGAEAYTSEAYARAEGERLWRKVWQQVGRVEEIPKVGGFLTYEIGDDGVIVVRTAEDTIKAFHNVCMHRGRRLIDTPAGEKQACGRAKMFRCGFHGWRWDLDGENVHILHQEDWGGALTPDRTRLRPVKVDTWGGWVWINFDPDAAPLRDYLEPAAGMLAPYELENMRYRWRRWLVFDCNWKVAMEAFAEVYHVEATHPEFTQFGTFHGWARAQGRHSNIGYMAPKGLEENQAKLRLGSGDPRLSTAEMQRFTWDNANTNTTSTLVAVAERLAAELPEGTPAPEVSKYWLETARREDAERGVHWPVVEPTHTAQAGTAWQIFPNFQIGHAVNNMLCYSARPYGSDPNKCIFEAAVYELFPEGEAPETRWEFTPPESPDWRSVLAQDFVNMAAVQKGLRSSAFPGTLTNPLQERSIANLHRNLAAYMGAGEPRPLD